MVVTQLATVVAVLAVEKRVPPIVQESVIRNVLHLAFQIVPLLAEVVVKASATAIVVTCVPTVVQTIVSPIVNIRVQGALDAVMGA